MYNDIRKSLCCFYRGSFTMTICSLKKTPKTNKATKQSAFSFFTLNRIFQEKLHLQNSASKICNSKFTIWNFKTWSYLGQRYPGSFAVSKAKNSSAPWSALRDWCSVNVSIHTHASSFLENLSEKR